MITVEEVLKKSTESAKTVNAVNEEKLRSGEIKVVKQSYWPYIFLAIGAAIGGWFFWRYQKGSQNDGAVSS